MKDSYVSIIYPYPFIPKIYFQLNLQRLVAQNLSTFIFQNHNIPSSHLVVLHPFHDENTAV